MVYEKAEHRRKEYWNLFKGYYKNLLVTAENRTERTEARKKAYRLASREHRTHYTNLAKADVIYAQYKKRFNSARTQKQLEKAIATKTRFVKAVKKEMRRHGHIKNVLGVAEIITDDREYPYGETPK